MDDETLKFVIVGHIDHGKSTLIGRLLFDTGSLNEDKINEIKEICESLGKDFEFGYVMDHLEEERMQSITIDTAQTFFNTEKRNYVIIDAPGHVEFIKNMITGASQAEASILIVDAEEGVKEQTKRHAYILSMLGLDQIIVVINKMDLVGYKKDRFDEVKKDILDFLVGLNIKPSYVIPISAKVGDFVFNRSDEMKWYDGPTVLESLDTFKSKEVAVDGPLRFVVQDVYNFEKRIIVGRVESGILRRGDRIRVFPSGEETSVKGIEEYLKEDVKDAEAKKCTGMTTEDKLFLDRGDVVARCSDDKLPIITDMVSANLFWMDKVPLKRGEYISFRCATQEVPCEVVKINKTIDSSTLELIREDAGEIKNREVADVILKTAKPVVLENFNEIQELGRFVLSREDICGGGIITELQR